MKHPYVVVWLAEGCVVQTLPTPRGRRNALLLNRGLVTAVLRLSEQDYEELRARETLSTTVEGGRSGESAAGSGDNGRSARTDAARRSRMGVVSGDDAGAAKPPGA